MSNQTEIINEILTELNRARAKFPTWPDDPISYQVAEFDLIQFFMNKADAEWVYETDKIAKQFAEFLFSKGNRITWYGTFIDEVQAYQAAADQLGIEINVLGDNAEAARKTAVLILAHWYDRHDGWNWEKVARETMEKIAAWEQLPGAAASPMAEHVARAQRHIEQKLAAEGEEAETAVIDTSG